MNPGDDWSASLNYFNYYTEVEEHFQKARGAGLFLLSPLDWALIESWKNAGVPLEAVLRGIDAAFEKWRSRKSRTQQVNSLAYCAQAVMKEADVLSGAAPAGAGRLQDEPPFPLEDVRRHLERGLADLAAPAYAPVAEALRGLLAELEKHYANLEEFEQALTALEDKMIAIARAEATAGEILEARRSLESELRPYRSKMSAPQLAMLEKRYLDRRTLEKRGLPRLSLFYL